MFSMDLKICVPSSLCTKILQKERLKTFSKKHFFLPWPAVVLTDVKLMRPPCVSGMRHRSETQTHTCSKVSTCAIAVFDTSGCVVCKH